MSLKAMIKFAYPEQVLEDRKGYVNHCIFIRSERPTYDPSQVHMFFLMGNDSHLLFMNAGILKIFLNDERIFYGEFIASSNNWNNTHVMKVKLIHACNFE